MNIATWLRKKLLWVLVIAIAAIAFWVLVVDKQEEDAIVSGTKLPQVTLTSALNYSGEESLSLIGTARAFSEAKVTSEASGRITSVNVELGQFVNAGQTIGSIENASERASVLQAEGAYESALAAAAQSGVSVEQAETVVLSAEKAAVSTFQSAYNTTNGMVRNNIDPFFSDPDARIPGLRLDGKGFTSALNNERVVYQTLLTSWQQKSNTISTAADINTELAYASVQVQRTITLIDTFLTVFANQDRNGRYSESEIKGFINSFTSLRSTLIGTQSSIDNAENSLSSAREGVEKAKIAASGGTTSAADAQIKQALGSLRAAQANLAKTVFSSPISGTVNAVDIRVGNFLSSFAPVATIANNNALEIVTYVSDTERSLLEVGSTVTIENEFEGIVTNIAPSVDSETGKTEVRVASEESSIANGDTVRISKTFSDTAALQTIQVPLSAVKLQAEDGSVFLLDNGRLVSRDITLGVIRGGSVEVTSGLTADEEFVSDARGLNNGDQVTVLEK